MKNPIVWLENKPVGTINSDGAFVTYRNEKGFFALLNGFGISKTVLKILKSRNIEKIVLIHRNAGIQKLYRATVKDFYEKGIIYNKGNDIQLILDLKYFKRGD